MEHKSLGRRTFFFLFFFFRSGSLLRMYRPNAVGNWKSRVVINNESNVRNRGWGETYCSLNLYQASLN